MPRPVPPPTVQVAQIPAPVGGLNTAAAGLALPPTDCPVAVNLLAAENGLRTRLGSREWAKDLSGASDNSVRTLISFSDEGGSTALFATTQSGIWDATSGGALASPDISFVTDTGDAGYGVYANIVAAGGAYCFYADEVNGLYRYDGSSWTKVVGGGGAGEISGLTPGNICFVMVFLGRLWFVEKGSASAYYLPVGQIGGTVSEFPVGMKFRNGGSLVGLWDWTYDGGSGVDNALVAISSGGDVLVYVGTDPDDATTFGLKGVWYIGPPPAGRRIASQYGGDLLIITRKGVERLSRLVVGIPDARAESLTYKVANLVNSYMELRVSSPGWALVLHPQDNALLFLIPQGSSQYGLQLAQSTTSNGWFLWTGLDMVCAAVYEGDLYFGTSTGQVMRNTGTVDNLLLGDSTNYDAIDWRLITAASEYGSPRQKQVGLVRPIILTDGLPPSIETAALYGYSQSELTEAALATSGGSGTWDNAIWDVDLWGGASVPAQPVRGTFGMGTAVSIGLRGSAISRVVLVAVDVTYNVGGFL